MSASQIDSAPAEISAPEPAATDIPAADAPATSPVPPGVPAPPLLTAGTPPVRGFFRRMILGLLFVLPIVVTGLIVYQIYNLLNHWVIEPVALLITPIGSQNPYWKSVETYVTPPISLAAVLLFLYLMGYLFQTRINRWLDWIVDRIPGISILYRAIRDAAAAVHGPAGLKTIDKVVLVPFPHPGARATGYLMGESEDEATGRKLACVYIPIALFPPSGYTLVYWRDEITVTNWDSASPWKMLLTGGLTLPGKVPFTKK